MRIVVEHRIEAAFDEPPARLVLALRVTPENMHDQTVAHWDIEPGRDARLRERRDGFGNRVTMLYADGPVESIALTVRGEVLTSHSDGVVRGTHEVLPCELYLRPTALTSRSAEVEDWARGVGGRDRLDALHRINEALYEVEAEAVDRVHRFISAARAIGAPARYVSGWCVELAGGDGHPGPHGWAEAHVDGLGWIGFDPALNLCPEEGHVRVAVGLDAEGAARVSGMRMG